MTTDMAIMPTSIVTDPPGASWNDLKPGDAFSTSVTVTNTFPYPVELSSTVTTDGALFAGPTPLVVTFDIVGGGQGTACPLRPHALPADAHARVDIDVSFPADAGNGYQNQSGASTLFFTATQLTPEECSGAAAQPGRPGLGGGLPATGLDLAVPVLAALALAAAGLVLRALIGRRRRDERLRP